MLIIHIGEQTVLRMPKVQRPEGLAGFGHHQRPRTPAAIRTIQRIGYSADHVARRKPCCVQDHRQHGSRGGFPVTARDADHLTARDERGQGARAVPHRNAPPPRRLQGGVRHRHRRAMHDQRYLVEARLSQFRQDLHASLAQQLHLLAARAVTA